MTRPDRVTRLGASLIQHGPANDRVYLMKLDRGDMPGIVDDVIDLARSNGYTKLFARVSARQAPRFRDRGFLREASAPGLYRGEESGYFLGKFLDGDRARPRRAKRMAEVLELARAKARGCGAPAGPDGTPHRSIQPLGPGSADDLAGLYAAVFESYPFPIHEAGYLRRAMAANVSFYGIRQQGRLVAAASSEMDVDWRCVEMTDFATLPETRGQGLAGRLLRHMEVEMAARGLVTAYTIARAESPGMNIVFSSAGYGFGGTLLNNTQIGGRLESMNVWHKTILAP